jgi:hypothetical protein
MAGAPCPGRDYLDSRDEASLEPQGNSGTQRVHRPRATIDVYEAPARFAGAGALAFGSDEDQREDLGRREVGAFKTGTRSA